MLKPLSIFKICIQLRVNVYHQQGKGRVKIVKSKQENFPRMLKKISPSYQGMLTFHPRIVFIDAHMRSRIIETKKSLRVSIQRYRPKRQTKQYSTPSLYILAKRQLQIYWPKGNFKQFTLLQHPMLTVNAYQTVQIPL